MKETIARAYAALRDDGSIEPDSIRWRVEDCCHDACSSNVAEVEIRIVRRMGAGENLAL